VPEIIESKTVRVELSVFLIFAVRCPQALFEDAIDF
jgi:hypothetical protein